ncbi:hypothetical protein JL720_5707 [Aureococcus anophagefferens]|nr:hypothetical protein JL720_5707 [Aureococcus anophagefferens]
MELGIPLTEKETNSLWSLVTTARGAQLGEQTLPLGFVAIAGAFHNESSLGLVAEGMNEKGLTGGATVPAVASHGLNTRMLPGGYTPPDRFVKMFLLRETAVAHEAPKTADDAVAVAAGLVNTVHIVRGTVPKLSKVDGYEWTNWAVLKLPGKRQFLVRPYNDMQWRRVDLTALDFSGKAYADVPLYRDLDAGIADVAF